MKPILAIIHFTRAAIDPINTVYGSRLAEEAEILNFLDEAVLRHTLQDGPRSNTVLNRVEDMLASAERAGACVIVSSGSSVSPAVDLVADRVRVPVLKVESSLAAAAALRFHDVTVVVTKRSNVEPFGELLDRLGRAQGKLLHVRFHVQESAFAALLRSSPDLHDRIMLEAIARAARDGAEAILVPQVSAARIMDQVPTDLGVPVLFSVGSSLEDVQGMIRARAGRLSCDG